MKNSTRGDLAVFDFNEEDERVTQSYPHWSKVSNPKSEENAITKYQFLQYASNASVGQMKEVRAVEHVHVVAIDDDDHGFISDLARGPLQLLENASPKENEGIGVTSGRTFEEQCHFVEDGDSPKTLSPGMEIKISSHFGSSPRNGLISSTISESPSSNDSAGVSTPDGHDSTQETSASIPASPLDEDNVPEDMQDHSQSVSGLELEDLDTVVLHTDYVMYCDRYFPACRILISKDTVKMKASGVDETSVEFHPEWDIDDIFSIDSHWSSVANVAKVKLHLLPKDAMHEGKPQGTSALKVLEFLVHDPNWSQRKELIKSLDVRYKALWRTELIGESVAGDAFLAETGECSSDPYIPNFEEPFEEVIYPKGDVDAVSISKRDVDLLQPETFVNDTIIDFYIKYLKNEIPLEERHRFHFFNSFFFRKLADLDKNPSSAFDGKAAFQCVRKWTRKVNIFEKDYIFIPVNYNLHWSLIVICHPGEVANLNDEAMDRSLKVPCILHMDSIRGSHSGLKDLLQSYLLEEWRERQKDAFEEISSKFLKLRFLSLELPQQENCSDCGLFLLHYAELFIAEAPANFSPFMINKFESFLKPDWFMPAEASLKRVHIQRLIYDLLEGHSEGSASPSCNRDLHPSALPENNENDNGIEIISEKRSPGNSWNANISYPQSVQGMNMGMLDVPLYRTSQCINDAGLGMRELLECGQYDQGTSFGHLGCSMSSIPEVAADEHLAQSTLARVELQPMDGIATGACHVDYSSRDFGEGFAWNSELSDQEELERDSSPVSNSSSDDLEEMRIVECNLVNEGASSVENEKLDQSKENVDSVTEIECDLENKGASLGENEKLDQSKENVDSLTESYASASSNLMETPPEDSQELDKKFGSNDEEDQLPSNPEEAPQPSQKELDNNDHGVLGNFGENLVAEDSDSDGEKAPKRMRFTPSLDEEKTLVTSLSKEL